MVFLFAFASARATAGRAADRLASIPLRVACFVSGVGVGVGVGVRAGIGEATS